MRHQLNLFVTIAAVLLAVGKAELTCPLLNPRLICKLVDNGLTYNDGCNTVQCGKDGNFLTTLKYCKTAPLTNNYCAIKAMAIQKRLTRMFSCPMLKSANVCPSVQMGFVFFDGCNLVNCKNTNSDVITNKSCNYNERAESTKAFCDELYDTVVGNSQFMCEKLNATEICLRYQPGFFFNDGCNGVTCQENGKFVSTLMLCDSVPDSSFFCSYLKKKLLPSDTARAGLMPITPYACRELRPQSVCTKDRFGFSYSDGCNQIRCTDNGMAISTRMYCPSDDDEDYASQAYCKGQIEKIDEKLRKVKRHTVCLKANEVCTTANSTKYYYDGCNYCHCLGKNRAGCTKLPCIEFYGTDLEFEAECKRREAHIIDY